MKNKTIIIFAAIIGCAILTVVGLDIFGNKKIGGAIYQNTGISTSVVASTTVSLALAGNSGAVSRIFVNTGANIITLCRNTTSTGCTAGGGLVLYPNGGSYEMSNNMGNLWTGNVWMITGTATSSLAISQL